MPGGWPDDDEDSDRNTDTENDQAEEDSTDMMAEAAREDHTTGHVDMKSNAEDQKTPGGNEEQSPSARDILKAYLLKNSKEFRTVEVERKKGWSSPDGDEYFRKNRERADNSTNPAKKTAATAEDKQYFYRMMQSIGKEMNQKTEALKVPGTLWERGKVLDMCMAPGGFLDAVMQSNRACSATAFTLPQENCGHEVLLPEYKYVTVRLLDITMLSVDMGVSMNDIPHDHPDRDAFLPRELSREQLFDLALCDGQLLREHERSAYRETREARRLLTTQLALGLEHLKKGGTMVVLLHGVEQLDNVELLHRFSKISSVQLFKPMKAHRIRSSFYMIATDIRTDSLEAKQVVEYWKHIWKVSTFGSDQDNETLRRKNVADVETLLEEFGEQLIEMARDVWKIQAEALADAPWMSKD